MMIMFIKTTRRHYGRCCCCYKKWPTVTYWTEKPWSLSVPDMLSHYREHAADFRDQIHRQPSRETFEAPRVLNEDF